MQRLWFPPGSASYKKADEIVVQDAWDSTREAVIQCPSAPIRNEPEDQTRCKKIHSLLSPKSKNTQSKQNKPP